MNLKKLTLSFMAGLVSVALVAGCGGSSGGDSGGSDGSSKPSAAPISKFELKGEPDTTVPMGSKTAKIYELKGAEDGDFSLEGERIALLGDGIFLLGEGKEGKGLYKIPIKDMKLGSKEFIAEAFTEDDHKRNLTVSNSNVLFEQKAEGHKLGVYDGISLTKEPAKWKDDYDEMAGSVGSDDILMVRSLDTICIGKRELSEIKGVQQVAADARKAAKLEDGDYLRPVYIDADKLFLSCQVDFDSFTTNLLSFDRKGKYLTRYEGLANDPGNWAVTKHYAIQVGSGGSMLVYNLDDAKKVFDSRLRDMEPSYIFSMGDDMLLLCSDSFGELKFYIMNIQ